MHAKLIRIAVAAALASGAALAANAEDRVYRFDSGDAHLVARAADWNLAAADGMCRLRIWVDDRARIKLHGDRIIVETDSGKRSFDEGSVCTQPLPLHAVENFHVVVEHGRGTVMEVRDPNRGNGYTGGVTVVDPENGGETYRLVMAWRNPGVVVGSAPAPLPPNEYTAFDETRACQDKVRAEFLQRNREGDAYVDFSGVPMQDEFGVDRVRLRGEGWAKNHIETRPLSYQCRLDERTQRVVSATYDLAGRPRLSSLQ